MYKVFVALSGGVDSAVAAHKLQTQGFDVTGVFIRAWQPDFLPCSQDEEERAALRVAAYLGIPFQRLDLSREYKEEVVDIMVSEYKNGRTPNPDVLCNSAIKFGAFLEYAKKNGADKIATGHHAQVLEDDGVFSLVRGADPKKDQAYFLWKLNQEELKHVLMPIGGWSKEEVRAYAQEHTLPSAFKPDSQGLCFIGHVDMKTFLSNFITTTKGDVLDIAGKIIGTHPGSELITLGQRGGFEVTSKDAHREVQYVVSKDLKKNTITVSNELVADNNSSQSHILLTNTNWIHPIKKDSHYSCELRYHGEPISCVVVVAPETTRVELAKSVLVAPGQSVVIYDKDICMGGGIVV